MHKTPSPTRQLFMMLCMTASRTSAEKMSPAHLTRKAVGNIFVSIVPTVLNTCSEQVGSCVLTSGSLRSLQARRSGTWKAGTTDRTCIYMRICEHIYMCYGTTGIHIYALRHHRHDGEDNCCLGGAWACLELPVQQPSRVE